MLVHKWLGTRDASIIQCCQLRDISPHLENLRRCLEDGYFLPEPTRKPSCSVGKRTITGISMISIESNPLIDPHWHARLALSPGDTAETVSIALTMMLPTIPVGHCQHHIQPSRSLSSQAHLQAASGSRSRDPPVSNQKSHHVEQVGWMLLV